MPAFLLIAQLTIAQPTIAAVVEHPCPRLIQITSTAEYRPPAWRPQPVTSQAPLVHNQFGGGKFVCIYGTQTQTVGVLTMDIPQDPPHCVAHEGGFSCSGRRAP